MNKSGMLFWIAILGFFGINGLDLANAITKTINELYFKLGNLLWIIIIAGIYLYANRK